MPLDVLETLARAWVFTSTRPYSTVDVISEAKRRGVMLDAALLRELYRRRFMTPLAEVVSRRVTEPRDVTLQPRPTGTRQSQVQSALQHGRIRDLTTSPFRPRTRFDRGRIGDPRGWWNGLVYSRWQLLALADIRPYLERQRRTGTYERPIVRVPPPGDFLPIYQEWTHAALILTALEARYLPLARPRWIRITNADIEEWEQYRDSFDPKLAIDAFGITSSEVRARAEGMLSRAKVLDPLGTWSLLVRRALPKAWETLSGDALMAHELRLAAEILLLFYEDLASAGVADPLPTIDHHWHHPLLDRISDRSDGPLDRLLAAKGISPHPGVVLIVEGETEFRMVGRIRDHLGLGRDPDTLQVVCMRSADRQLPLLAAATAAPILGERRGDAFDMIRPPTRLVIAIDPDDLWDTDRKIAKQKRLIVEEIAKVTRAQGAIIDADELDRFVEVYTWDERCFGESDDSESRAVEDERTSGAAPPAS